MHKCLYFSTKKMGPTNLEYRTHIFKSSQFVNNRVYCILGTILIPFAIHMHQVYYK